MEKKLLIHNRILVNSSRKKYALTYILISSFYPKTHIYMYIYIYIYWQHFFKKCLLCSIKYIYIYIYIYIEREREKGREDEQINNIFYSQKVFKCWSTESYKTHIRTYTYIDTYTYIYTYMYIAFRKWDRWSPEFAIHFAVIPSRKAWVHTQDCKFMLNWIV